MTGYDQHVTNEKRELMNEQFLETLEGIRLALSYLGTGRPPGRESRGALELLAGSIAGESGALAERLSDGLAGIRDAVDRLRDVRYAKLDASARYRSQAHGPYRQPDESVQEFTFDWLEVTGDETHRIPRALVNRLYTFWCEQERISPEDRVTTSVLRRSLNLLGAELVSGQPDHQSTRMHSFVGVRVRDGVQEL